MQYLATTISYSGQYSTVGLSKLPSQQGITIRLEVTFVRYLWFFPPKEPIWSTDQSSKFVSNINSIKLRK
jgi:hypothetical protein